jgi:hypothetical protein
MTGLVDRLRERRRASNFFVPLSRSADQRQFESAQGGVESRRDAKNGDGEAGNQRMGFRRCEGR